MAQDRPSARNLLATVREFLQELLPTLEGEARFKTRVSIHLLGIVERELADAAASDAAELSRLQGLLGRTGELPELNAELARQIRSGQLDARSEEVMTHVLRTVEDKVRIVNPGHLGAAEE